MASFELSSIGSPALSDSTMHSSGTGDGPQNCQWRDCGRQMLNAEELFIHVTEEHVGRNATGNLCLQCQWAECNISKSKRDHLISHIKSHLSYKPYACGMCEARFKHQSDLKRHENTHRDKLQSPAHTDYDQLHPASHLPLAYGSPDSAILSNTAYGLPPSPMSTPGMQSQHFVPAPGMSPGLAMMTSGEFHDGQHAIFPATTATGDMIDPTMLGAGPDGYLPTPTASNVYNQFLHVAATQQYTNPELASVLHAMLLQMSLINPVLLEELIRNTPSDQLAQLQTCQIHLTKQLEMQTVDMMNSGQSGTLGSMLIAPLSPPTSEVNVASPVPYIPSIPPAISNYVKLDKGLNLAGTSKKESSSDSVLSSIIDKMKQVRIVPSSVLDGKNARHPSTEDMVAGAKPTTTSTAASSTSSASAGATTGKDGIKRYTAKPSRAAKRYDTQTSHSMARMRATSTSSKPEAEGATTTTTDTNHSQNVSDADTLPEESTDNNNNNNAKHEQSEQMRQVLDRLRQHVDQIMEARSLAREVTSNSNNSDDNNDGSGSSDIEQSSTMNKDKHDATQ